LKPQVTDNPVSRQTFAIVTTLAERVPDLPQVER
jgi:hypothetical protein